MLRCILTISLGSLFLVMLAIAGCSGGAPSPLTSPDNIPPTAPPSAGREIETDRMLWGIWDIYFDPSLMKATAIPVRNPAIHFDVTEFLLPPNCDDCVQIAVNSFDPVTRIMDVDVTLRNPTPLNGRDVRGILYTNKGHLLVNDDNWTELWDIPGGGYFNPFKAFAKTETKRVFAAYAEHVEKFLVSIPKPPQFDGIRFAVDASWPGNCREPYSLENFTQLGELYDFTGATVDLTAEAYDWQDDIIFVGLAAMVIDGGPLVAPFHFEGGNLWALELFNGACAPAGDYDLALMSSSSSPDVAWIRDYVVVTITETPPPAVDAIDPDAASVGASLTDVEITGTNFFGPPCSAKLVKSGQPDIVAENVAIVDEFTLTCDVVIPIGADPGLYDVVVTNGKGLDGSGAELFEVSALALDVTGIDPDSAQPGEAIGGVTVTGSNFVGVDTQVNLKMSGEPDIEAENVMMVDSSTITCGISIPYTAKPGLYDVEVIEAFQYSAVGAELFEIIEPVLNPTDVTPEWLNWAQPWDVCVSGNLAYIAGDFHGLHIADITDILDPAWLGRADTPSQALSVVVEGDYAYVADTQDGLYIFNVSNPYSPVFVKDVALSGIALDIAVNEGYAYITNFQPAPYLDIVDIDPPETASVVKTVDLGLSSSSPQCVALYGGYAYVACSSEGLKVVDVDPVASASVVATIPPGAGNMRFVATDGTCLYVCNYNVCLAIFDLVDPALPALVKAVTCAQPCTVAIGGDGYAYVAEGGDGGDGFIQVVDIDPPEDASIVYTLDSVRGESNGIAVYDSYLLHPGIDCVYAIDISHPLAAFIAYSVHAPYQVEDIAVGPDYAYVVNYECGVGIYDDQPPEYTYYEAFIDIGQTDNVEIYGDYAYIIHRSAELIIADVNPPDAIEIIKTVGGVDTSGGMDYYNGYIYMTWNDGMHIIDVDPPADAFVVNSMTLDGDYFADISVDNGYAYITADSEGLHIIDITTPGSEVVVNTADTGQHTNAVHATGGYAYVAVYVSGDTDFKIVDVDPPGTAGVVKTIGLSGEVYNLVASGGYAYVPTADGLTIIDIAPPESAFVFTTAVPPFAVGRVCVRDNYAYAGGGRGMAIFKLW